MFGLAWGVNRGVGGLENCKDTLSSHLQEGRRASIDGGKRARDVVQAGIAGIGADGAPGPLPRLVRRKANCKHESAVPEAGLDHLEEKRDNKAEL